MVVHVRSSNGFFGAERVIVTLLTRLAALGVPCRLLVLEDHATHNRDLYAAARAAGIEARLIPCKGRLDPAALRALIREARAAGATVVHTHDVKSDLYGGIAAWALGCRAVATLHGRTSHTRTLRLYERLDRFILARFDALLSVLDPAGGGQVGAPRGWRAPRPRFAPNGVDTDLFNDRVTGLGRPHWGIPQGAFVFGTVARLTPEKGHALLLAAFAELAGQGEAGGRAFLLLVGDGPLRPELERRAQELGVADRVRFAGPRDGVERILHDLDCYVSPSHTEGMPMVVLEALASAVSVIATDVGAVRDMVGPAGIVVPPGDAHALAEAMGLAAGGGVDLKGMGRQGRRRALERFGADAQARVYQDAYRELAG